VKKKLKEGTRIARVRDVATVISDMDNWVSVQLPSGQIENWTRYSGSTSFITVKEGTEQ
jgi:hypothetical protein